MPATTILASFDEAVPIRTDPIVEDPKAHISGPSTSAAEPPKFGLRLQNFFARISVSPLNHSRLRDSYLATWEETRSLRLEADIFQLNQEVVDGGGGRARADKTWHQRLDPHTRRFAVLDYKRPGVIKPKEFNRPLCGQEQLAQRISAAGNISTLFSHNSNILLKQAVNYSFQYQTKYIAYFDWDTLLLIYLQDAEGINGGIYCYIELLTDRSQFRRALLGFLEAAYQSQGGHGRGGPTYPTPYSAHQ